MDLWGNENVTKATARKGKHSTVHCVYYQLCNRENLGMYFIYLTILLLHFIQQKKGRRAERI